MLYGHIIPVINIFCPPMKVLFFLYIIYFTPIKLRAAQAKTAMNPMYFSPPPRLL